MQIILALLSGLIFGFGLILSGMTDPAKVIAFLDMTGQWNPALAFVMIGAISMSMIGFIVIKGNPHSLLGTTINLPQSTRIDTRLLKGAALFGIGWGMAGFCPGPAITSLGTALPLSALFVVAMAVGILLTDRFFSK